MVADVSMGPNPKVSSQRVAPETPKRRPLALSDADNGKPKSREVTSRYLSTSTSSSSSSNPRRCPSPLVSRSVSMTPVLNSGAKRPQSVERRRSETPPNGGVEISNAAKLLVSSTRRLSVSFRGDSFSLPDNKAKAASATVSKGTPERRKVATPVKDQAENSKPSDQHRWPGRSNGKIHTPVTKSVDFTGERMKLAGSRSAVRSLHTSMIDEGTKTTAAAKVKLKRDNANLKQEAKLVDNIKLATQSAVTSDLVPSETENVSSGRNFGIQERESATLAGSGPRGIVVPARFWQEANNRLRRTPEPSSPFSKNDGVKKVVFSQKPVAMKKTLNESTLSSPHGVTATRGSSSPLRDLFRPASPSKFTTLSTSSPSRRMPSPSRVRNGVASMPSNNLSNAPSILSFAVDAKRGKIGENRIVDAHALRCLYNRYLQWRYINARADAAQLVQRESAEKSLYNAWVTTTKLQHSVKFKRIEIQLLRQNLKLYSLLKGQMLYLDNWDLIHADHFSSLLGAIKALEASILCLPLVSGARAEAQDINDAIHSATDVMQAMASSVCLFLTKVERVNLLVSELANVTANECSLLGRCKEFLSALTTMQVKDFSMRTHILQLQQMVSSMTAEV